MVVRGVLEPLDDGRDSSLAPYGDVTAILRAGLLLR